MPLKKADVLADERALFGDAERLFDVREHHVGGAQAALGEVPGGRGEVDDAAVLRGIGLSTSGLVITSCASLAPEREMAESQSQTKMKSGLSLTRSSNEDSLPWSVLAPSAMFLKPNSLPIGGPWT